MIARTAGALVAGLGLLVTAWTLQAQMTLPPRSTQTPLPPRSGDLTLRPDLVAVALSAPSQIAPGAPFPISVTARNAGRFSANGGWLLQVYLSRDPALTPKSVPIAPPLRVGKAWPVGVSETLRLQATVPPSMPAGRYYVFAALDSTNVIQEASEQNNLASRAVELIVPGTPNVTNFNPRNYPRAGSTLTINGVNFLPAFISVSLAGQRLTLVNSSTTLLTVQLPKQTAFGDLVVSHGSPASSYTVASNYAVFGTPTITSVQPAAFQTGQTVTLQGTGLFKYNAGPHPWNDSPNKFIKIGADNLSFNSVTFVRVTNWQASEDGRTATFMAQEVWNMVPPNQTAANPQPSTLSGTIRLIPEGSNLFDVVGPAVSWAPAPLALTSFAYSDWTHGAAKATPTFILTDWRGSLTDRLRMLGVGLNGASVSIGTQALGTISSADGYTATLIPPYGTTSGYLIVSKGGKSAKSTQVVNLVLGPKIDESNSSPELTKQGNLGPSKLKLGTQYTLRGWDLTPPSAATGMTIRYEPTVTAAALQACGVVFQIISHTANQIAVRFIQTGAIPATCLSGMLFNTTSTSGYYGLYLTLSYGGVDRLWLNSGFSLTAP